MRIDIATIFPEMFAGPLGTSIIARAQEQGTVELYVHDLRDFTDDKHRSVDDYPYGGGAGMVMRPEPFFRLHDFLCGGFGDPEQAPEPDDAGTGIRPYTIMFSPAGRRLEQQYVRQLACEPWLLLLCGHYEGVDHRVTEGLGAQEVSLGDFVLTGGELPAMVVSDAVIRLLPGVLGGAGSLAEESFSGSLLEYPQYTRPPQYRGLFVPEVLMSGNHGAIAAWRQEAARQRTASRRPDLLR